MTESIAAGRKADVFALLTGRGPVVIDWRNADGGGSTGSRPAPPRRCHGGCPAELDTAFTALIPAQVAIDSIGHPTGAGAG